MKIFEPPEFLAFLRAGKFAFFRYYSSKALAAAVYTDFLGTESCYKYLRRHFNCYIKSA